MSQCYGALRMIQTHRFAYEGKHRSGQISTRRSSAGSLIHVLTHHETTIGRALTNDIVLLDPLVSRKHACLWLGRDGWHIMNTSQHNDLSVNEHPLISGESLLISPQDVLLLGETTLQLVAPSFPQILSTMETKVTPAPDLFHGSLHTPGGLKRYPFIHHLKRLSLIVSVVLMQHGTPFSAPAETEVSLNPEGTAIGISHWRRLIYWLIFSSSLLAVSTVMSAALTFMYVQVINLFLLFRAQIPGLLTTLFLPLPPALGIIFLVNALHRYKHEPGWLQLLAFLWGAAIAIPLSFLLEQLVNTTLSSTLQQDTGSLLNVIWQGISAGIIEETLKGLGLVLLFLLLRDVFHRVSSGIVYGVLIGGGFALVENFFYFSQTTKDEVMSLIVGRIVLGWLMHPTFTACFGVALGYAWQTPGRWRKWLLPIGGYLLAVSLHGLFNIVTLQASMMVLVMPANSTTVFFSEIMVLVNYLPPFIVQFLLLIVLIRALAYESEIMREFLVPEVSRGVVTVEEYVLLQNWWRRTQEELRVLRIDGIKQWMRIKALYQAEMKLAFYQWSVSKEANRGKEQRERDLQQEEACLHRIQHVRDEIIAAQERDR